MTPTPAAARRAVAAAFFVNGAGLSSWAPRIPQVQQGLALSPGELGLALAGVSVGAIVATLVAGALVSRWGSRRVTVAAGLLLCLALPLPGLVGGGLLLAVVLALAGAGDGAQDVAMNAHGVAVEHGYGRPIMSSLHAWWSAGSGAGALAGAAAAALAVPVALHLAVTAVVLVALQLVAARRLLPGDADRVPRRRAPLRAVASAAALLAVAALLAAMVESVALDWSAVYATEAMDASPGVAGATYAAFAVAMVASRAVGDRGAARLGTVRLVRGGAVVAAAGLTLALLAPAPAAAVAGFAVMGVGAAALFPSLFGAAGRRAGLSPGAGIGAVALVARTGFLLAPPLIGGLAETVSLRAALSVGVAAALALALLAGPALGRTG